MKRIIGMAMAFLMVFAMASCGSQPSPADGAKKFLDETKETMKSVVDEFGKGSDDDVLKDLGLDQAEMTRLDKETIDSLKEVVTKMSDFDYKIVDEKLSKDKTKAIVTVEIKSYNLGLNLTDSLANVIPEMTNMAFSGKSEDEVINYMVSSIVKKMADAEKSYSKIVKMELEFKDNQWEVNEDNEDLQDGITGGMLTALDQMSNMLK